MIVQSAILRTARLPAQLPGYHLAAAVGVARPFIEGDTMTSAPARSSPGTFADSHESPDRMEQLCMSSHTFGVTNE